MINSLAFSIHSEINISPIIQKKSPLRVLADFTSSFQISSSEEIHQNINGKNAVLHIETYRTYNTRVNVHLNYGLQLIIILVNCKT